MRRSSKKKDIAIDFDGVLHRYSRGWGDGSIYDKPVAGAKEAMDELSEKYNIVVFSRRAKEQGGEAIENWLRKNKIKFTEVTGEKPRARWYIDDQAVHFDDWAKTLKRIKKLEARYAKRNH
ncbi:MAG: hypothetical protein M1153_02845 [Patescibacteria group bacterium]|nr:hypothetical protein [Patescibacteria group bacterium]